MDALFALERDINGGTPQEGVLVRNERSRPLGERQAQQHRPQRRLAGWPRATTHHPAKPLPIPASMQFITHLSGSS
jgi:hypothetical protein